MLSVEFAVSVTFRAPVSITLSPICACVVAGTWFIANETPTPTLPPNAVELAVAVLVVLFWALIVTSGSCPRQRHRRSPRIPACDVSAVTRFSATEPATPTFPPSLAPDVAVATKLFGRCWSSSPTARHRPP